MTELDPITARVLRELPRGIWIDSRDLRSVSERAGVARGSVGARVRWLVEHGYVEEQWVSATWRSRGHAVLRVLEGGTSDG